MVIEGSAKGERKQNIKSETNTMKTQKENQKNGKRIFITAAGSLLAVTLASCGPKQQEAATPLTGEWSWFTGQKVFVKADGTFEGATQIRSGKIEVVDKAKGIYRFSWDNGAWVDTVTLDSSGSKLEGKNQQGDHINAERVK